MQKIVDLVRTEMYDFIYVSLIDSRARTVVAGFFIMQ